MTFLSRKEFADLAGVGDRVARRAFAKGIWQGHTLPVLRFASNGGSSGMVRGLALDSASPDLLALLRLPVTLPSTPVQSRLKGRFDDRHVTRAVGKQRIIAPILAHPKGSHGRAASFRAAAGQQHRVGAGWVRFGGRALRDWVLAAEAGGVAALMPIARSDKGKVRMQVARDRHDGSGSSQNMRADIAKRPERNAHGLILEGRSDRNTRELCRTELDVARSLHEVFSCPCGGVPREIVIDNGCGYKALPEAVMRFGAMADIGHSGVVHCRPYGLEGKGRLEGAFGIPEKTFMSALPGHIAGDRMKSPTKSKGTADRPLPAWP